MRINPLIAAQFSLLLLGVFLAMPSFAQNSSLDQAAVVLAQVTGKDVRPFSSRDFGREQNPKGRSVLIPNDSAERFLELLRQQLPPGAIAFVGVTNSLAHPKPEGVELVVAEGKDQFDILRVASTDGINYGLQTEDIVRELQIWDQEYGIDIWQAETDTVQLRLRTTPKNLHEFAARVYKFCPDIVDQGVGDIRALEQAIAESKGVFLWWD